MRTTVTFHESVRQPLQEWLARLAARRPGGEIIARVALDDIVGQLIESPGKLRETIDDTVKPSLYWWEYMPGIRLAYMIRHRGFGPWRTRRIIVVEVAEHPPSQGA